jgi:probable ATP-dependent RNA helicase DDX4
MLFTTGIHQGINFEKYDNIEVEVTGNNRPKPVEQFDDMGLLPTFLQNVKKAGYLKPTPIQKHAIPAVLSGRDLMGCAQTGSGKTVRAICPWILMILS